MIEYLKGTLDELTPTLAVVECAGVGYGVNISLNTFAALQGKQEVKLWITEAIREDAYQLWMDADTLKQVLDKLDPNSLRAAKIAGTLHP